MRRSNVASVTANCGLRRERVRVRVTVRVMVGVRVGG